MGGEGSGRKPSVETIIKRMTPEQNPLGNSIFIPNYSGIQKAVLKSETGLTAGSILFIDTNGKIVQDNVNLIWDDTNNRLGIGTTSPSEALTLGNNGNIFLSTNRITNVGEGSIKLKFDDGEVKNKAKAIIAYVDENDDEVVWLQTHDWLNDSNQHKHFSIEAAKADGTKNTNFSVSYGADTNVVNVNAADFCVAGTGGIRTIDSD